MNQKRRRKTDRYEYRATTFVTRNQGYLSGCVAISKSPVCEEVLLQTCSLVDKYKLQIFITLDLIN